MDRIPEGVGCCSVSLRWAATLSSKVNLPDEMNFRALGGANLVTLHPGIEGGRNLRTLLSGFQLLKLFLVRLSCSSFAGVRSPFWTPEIYSPTS